MPDPIKDLFQAVKDTSVFLSEQDLRNQIQKSPKDVFDVVSKSGLFLNYDDFTKTVLSQDPPSMFGKNLEEIKNTLKGYLPKQNATDIKSPMPKAKQKAEFEAEVEASKPKVEQLKVFSTPKFKVTYPEQQELSAKVAGFQNAAQMNLAQQNVERSRQEEVQKAADELYETKAGKLYFNFIQPLANAGATNIGNIGATVARTFDQDAIADALVNSFTPEKRWEGTIAGTTPTKLQGNFINDSKADFSKLPSLAVSTLANAAWLIAPSTALTKAGVAANMSQRMAQSASLIGTSFVQQRENYYQEALSAGLSREQASDFATTSAGITSALEAFFPNKLAIGDFQKKLANEAAKQIAKGVTTRSAVKAAVKDLIIEAGVKENAQEILQLAGDKLSMVISDMESGKNNFSEHLSLPKIKDELTETVIITPVVSLFLAGPNTIRNYRPTNYEKSLFYDASKNADKVLASLDNQLSSGGISQEQHKEAVNKFKTYKNTVDQISQFGYGEDQTMRMAWEVFSGREKLPVTKSVSNDPILSEALGDQIKKDKAVMAENIKLIGMGVPSVGTEVDGKEVAQVIANIGDKGREIDSTLEQAIGDGSYRLEEVNVKELYNTNPEFKEYVDQYKSTQKDPDGLLVPAVMKDGAIVDGRARLAEQYLAGKESVKVFKSISDAITESEVQAGIAEGNIGQPQGTVQGQPEVGQGAGTPGQAQVPQANVGDSNIGSKGEVAPGKKLFNEPVPEVAVVEAEFKKSKGIDTPEPAPITRLDEERSKRIADAYEALQDTPDDPEVQKAYQAMADETMEQFAAIDKAGVKVEIWTGEGEPYKNSGEMIADVRDNKHMYIFSTEQGFGDTPITEEQRQQNALLRDSGVKDVNGKTLLINDIFRFVHDYFGHARLGNSFGAIGEENAWNVHARMYSPLARRAMTTETRGQNSWVNFNRRFRNPDGTMKKKGDEGYVPPAQRPFADQKMALLPEEFSQIEESYSVKEAESVQPAARVQPAVAEQAAPTAEPAPATPITNRLDQAIAAASNALRKLGISFEIIDDPSGQAIGGNQAIFQDENGKVTINKAKLRDAIEAGLVVWHEASHPVINILRNTNKPLYDAVVRGLKQSAQTNKGVADAQTWAQREYADKGEATVDDEAVVETIARIAEGLIDPSTIEAGLKQRLIDFINAIARMLNIDLILDDTDIAKFRNVAAQVSEALRTGEDVAGIVGEENVGEYKLTDLDGNPITQGSIQNRVSGWNDLLNGITFKYLKDSDTYNNLKESGFITEDKRASDFSGMQVVLHVPDHAFTGEMIKDGEVIVEGKGGVFYPLRFHDLGYFWASTENSATSMTERLNSMRAQSPDGKIRLMLLSAPQDKLMSSTAASNSMLDVLLSKAFDRRAKIKKDQVVEAYKKGIDRLKEIATRRGKDGVKFEGTLDKFVRSLPKIKKSMTVDEFKSSMRKWFAAGVSNFDQRKKLNERVLQSVAELVTDAEAVDQVFEFFRGIAGAEMRATGGRLSMANLVDGFSRLFSEPMLKGETRTGDAYAVIELDGDVEAVESKEHESYPFAIRSKDSAKKPVVHILQDRVNWSDFTIDPSTGDLVSPERRQNVLPPTSGVSGVVTVKATPGQASTGNRGQLVDTNGNVVNSILDLEKGTLVNVEDAGIDRTHPLYEGLAKKFKTIQVYGGRPSEGAAFYDTKTKTIKVNKNSTHWKEDLNVNTQEAILHEYVHNLIDDSPSKDKVMPILKEMKDEMKQMGELPRFGEYIISEKNSPEEVATYGITNQGISDFIENSSLKPKMDEVKRLLDIPQAGVQASVGNRLLAPNGKPSNLTPKQYEQVRTPQFKAWFGDWENDPENASKVVDENGEPMVVYHGGTLNPDDRGKDTYTGKYGIYFTSSRSRANSYAKAAGDNYKNKTNLFEVYLNIKNPLPKSVWGKFKNNLDTIGDNEFEKFESTNSDGAIDKGVVGIKYLSQFVVFNPNQIKSATDNSGEFSTTDNRIQASVGNRGDLVEAAGKRKQMTEDDNGNYVFFHYSNKNFRKVDPGKFGGNIITGRDERPGVGISMFYTRPDEREFTAEYGYTVRIPKDQVYPFNDDPLNLLPEAKKAFEKDFPDQAFDSNKQLGYVTKIAAEKGYPMTVAEWKVGKSKGLRAQTTEKLAVKPYMTRNPYYSNVYDFKEEFKPNAKRRMQASVGNRGRMVMPAREFFKRAQVKGTPIEERFFEFFKKHSIFDRVTIAVIPGLEDRGVAYPDANRIELHPDSVSAPVLTHEMLHMIMGNILRTPKQKLTASERALREDIEDVFNNTDKRWFDIVYGQRGYGPEEYIHEFVSDIFTENAQGRRFGGEMVSEQVTEFTPARMEKIEKGLIERIIDIISSWFGKEVVRFKEIPASSKTYIVEKTVRDYVADSIRRNGLPSADRLEQLRGGGRFLRQASVGNRGTLMQKTSKSTMKSIKDFLVNSWYGYLPQDIQEALKKKQMLINVDMNRANVLSQRLDKQIREAYGVSYNDLDQDVKDTLDAALRNFDGVDMADRPAMRSSIPPKVLSTLVKMRNTVDSMSRKLTELGLLDPNLEPAFDGETGLGVYINRSYRKYDDKEWVNKIPEPIRQRAIAYIQANIEVYDDAGNARPLTDDEIEGLINYIATNTDPVMQGLNSANAGRAKVDILKGRKDIPEEIRDLMGEYKDPMVNFAKSIAKMSTLIHTHQTLQSIADANIGTVFFRTPTKDHFVPVAGKDVIEKNGTVLQPLSGLFTTPEIAEAFKKIGETISGEDINGRFIRMIGKINAAIKVGKTAYSPASMVRNMLGGFVIMIKDGHILGTGFVDGAKVSLKYFWNKSQEDPEFQAKVDEYIENGIIGEGVQIGELQAMIKASQEYDNPIDWLSDTKAARGLRSVKAFYSMQDDIFRVWAYENERARLASRKPNMTEAELTKEAARKARATYPTYSEVPKVVQQLAKFIPIASFPAFSAEMIRTTKNSIKIAFEEIADPDMRDVGIKRLAGTTLAMSLGGIASGVSAMFAGIGDEEEEAVREFLPEWSRNSQLLWLGRDENGLPRYIDLGFSNPFAYFTKPVVALTQDGDLDERIEDATKELLSPFLAPEIFVNALLKGYDKVEESDTKIEAAGRFIKPLYEAIEPGAFASGRRIAKGLSGDVDDYGQAYDAELEIKALVTGQRIKKLDVPVAFDFKAREFNRLRSSAFKDFRTEKKKTVSNPEKAEAKLAEGNRDTEKYFTILKKKYQAALLLMSNYMPIEDVEISLEASMKESGIPSDIIKAIVQDLDYPTYEPEWEESD